jgi:hypothetical protein
VSFCDQDGWIPADVFRAEVEAEAGGPLGEDDFASICSLLAVQGLEIRGDGAVRHEGVRHEARVFVFCEVMAAY